MPPAYRVQYEAARRSLEGDPTPTNPRVTTDLGYPYAPDVCALSWGEIMITYRLVDERVVQVGQVIVHQDPALHL